MDNVDEVYYLIKLTKYEQTQRSRVKKRMLVEDPSWSSADIKLHLAQLPELWVAKKKPITEAEYQRRLKQLKDQWCPKQIIYWKAIIESIELDDKKKG